jgi:bifunctional UDP-N-acetylglucosamine pyrophosphorylase/glucosamine-1-phosphate N-acetyltransferase
VKAENFLVMCGDVMMSENDIAHFIKETKQTQASYAAMVAPLGNERPNDWLCADVKGNKINSILGHPRDDVTHRLCGVYMFDPASGILPYLQNNPGIMTSVQVGTMPPTESELAQSLQMAIEDGKEVVAVEPRDYFVDVDKPWHLLEANTVLLKHRSSQLTANSIATSAKVHESAEIEGFIVVGEHSIIGRDVKIKGNLWVGKNTTIVDGAIIEGDVVIGDDCHVRRYCQIGKQTSIGNRCVIGHCAEVEGMLMDGVYSYHYGEYWGIIGSGTDLGAATVCGNLRFDDAQTVHLVKGRRETPLVGANAAYLGDYVRTGVNVIIMPGVKVGPYSVIGAGTIVGEDVPENTLLYVEQNLIRKKWGSEKYGW